MKKTVTREERAAALVKAKADLTSEILRLCARVPPTHSEWPLSKTALYKRHIHAAIDYVHRESHSLPKLKVHAEIVRSYW